MRVLYYTTAEFLEPALALTPEMSGRAEFHVLVELSPETWSSALFDVAPRPLPAGVVPAAPVLRECLPPALRHYWEPSASFHFLVHRSPKSIHPATGWVSHRGARFIRSLRPDVIHVENISLRMVPGLLELRRIPLVLSTHDPESHSGEHNWRKRLADRLVFPAVKRFILYNRSLRPQFCSRHGVPEDRVEVLPLGVFGMCREWNHQPVAEEERTILFFGRVSRYKGLEVLYEAAPRVARQVRGVRFVVAGRAVPGYRPPRPPALPNDGSIDVVDRYIHNGEMARLVGSCALVVCPYVDATQSAVVLTAYAFGKPVVATRVGGLPEYVEDGVTGLLVEPRDPVALAEGLIRILQDRPLRERMHDAVRFRADTVLSWRSIAERLTPIYRRAVEE